MIVTYKNLKDITFPAFLLPSSNWSLQDGILFLDNMVLDDQNMPGKTLGLRRLQTPFRTLVNLRKAVTSPVGVIKQSNQPFIDSLGKLFIYEKTIYTPLKYYKIKRIDKKGTYSLVWLRGVNSPFEVSRPPLSQYVWAAVLHIKQFPWMLYEYSEAKLRDTIRKI